MSSLPRVTATDADWTFTFDFAADSGQFRFNRRTAITLFDRFLGDSDGRQQLLPYLSFMATVLGTHTRDDELREWLYECCGKLEISSEVGQPFVPFFNYLLAFGLQDEAMIAHHGQSLERAASSMAQLDGATHASRVSSKNFQIWHQLYTNTSPASVLQSELLACISEAEQITGSTDLLAVNSLALLGRLLQEQKHYAKAAEIFRDAISRLESCSQIFNAYKLEIVQRLAAVEYDSGHSGTSNVLLLEVYVGRIQALGKDHAYTAGVLQQLREHLREVEESENKGKFLPLLKAAI